MRPIHYQRTEREVHLAGYGTRRTAGTVHLVSFDRTQRLRRAWLGLATWWSVAVASAFIPVAHFALVPGFLVFGVYSFRRRAKTHTVAVSLHGVCPDCDAEQDFDLPSEWSDQAPLSCGECHRSLRLSRRPDELPGT